MVLSIFVVGYRGQGESIVVLFRDENGVSFSMVIDCYRVKDANITRKILSDYGVKKVDVICWTHPHWDHTKGMDEFVDQYFGKETVVFLPKYYFGDSSKSMLIKEQCPQALAIFEKIWKKFEDVPLSERKNRYRTMCGVGDKESSPYPMSLHAADGCSEEKEVCLFFLTPLSDLFDAYAITDEESGKPNELSISFVMSVDGYDFFFGGDVENENAENIDKSVIDGMRWIKVPHHCSRGAISIAERLGPYLDFSVSTVHNPSGLPHNDIQDMYANCASHLFMTELPNTRTKKYGVVQCDYRFGDNEINVEVKTYGNAGRYYSKT